MNKCYIIREDDYDKSFIIPGVVFNDIEKAQNWIKKEFDIPYPADETSLFFYSFFPNGDRRDFYIEPMPTSKEITDALDDIEDFLKSQNKNLLQDLKSIRSFVQLML